jgi:hypothetical protein
LSRPIGSRTVAIIPPVGRKTAAWNSSFRNKTDGGLFSCPIPPGELYVINLAREVEGSGFVVQVPPVKLGIRAAAMETRVKKSRRAMLAGYYENK